MNNPRVFAHTCYVGPTGYSNHSRSFFRELSKLCRVKVRNFPVGEGWEWPSDDPHGATPDIFKLDKELLVEQSLWGPGRKLVDYPIYSLQGTPFQHNINIILDVTEHYYYYHKYDGPKIAYNVWEQLQQPEEFFEILQQFDQVWVPTHWQRDFTIFQGMHPDKVKVVPEAVDGTLFKPDYEATLPEYDDNRFKFLLFGRWSDRKSTLKIIESFLEEFGKDEPVDLVISADEYMGGKTADEMLQTHGIEDRRLKTKHFPSREDYVKYLQRGHVFLSCARSEGWNLPLLEAMACGTPAIYSNGSGQLEFAKGRGLPVNLKSWYNPDFDHLKKQMRNAYTNYGSFKDKAIKESEEVRKEFTWEKAAQIAYDILKDF